VKTKFGKYIGSKSLSSNQSDEKHHELPLKKRRNLLKK
jgi:hypothetical protein